MDIKQMLIDTLENAFNLPVYQQGSMSENEAYPNSFFTIFNNSVIDDVFYNNDAEACVWDFDVNIYSDSPTLVNTKLKEVKKELKKQAFIIVDGGYDVMSDEVTHTGRGMNVLFVEKLNNESEE